MILADLKRYLMERRQATLSDMAVHFAAEPEAVRAMLSVWIAKGRVERVPVPASCGTSCTLCDPRGAEIYRWIDAADQSPSAANLAGRP